VTFTDNTARPQMQSYYYQVVSVDSCGHDAQTSAYSRTIYLQAVANSDRTNTLNWNDYEGWLGGVGSYDVYRSIDGSAFALVGSVNYPATTYVDDVDPYFTSSGRFTYYVQAHEAAVNVYNLQESSNSNPAVCYQQSKFFVPNAFAPHGVNTIFLPLGAYYDKTEYSLSIYNRWGEKLFETDDYTQGWDGTYQGEKCWQGVYIYLIRYKTSVGELIDLGGTVTLLGK
jgi:gliding motility-associated-like protein